GREQIPASLIAAHARVRHDHGCPTVEPPRCDFDRAPNRADMRRGVECRADLVVNHTRARGGEHIEYGWQVFVHPMRIVRPGHTGYADHPRAGKGTQTLWRWRCEEKYSFQAGKGSHLH